MSPPLSSLPASFTSQWIPKNGQNPRIPLGNPLYHTRECLVSSKNGRIKCHYQALPDPTEGELQLFNSIPCLENQIIHSLKHLIWSNLQGWFSRNGRDLLIFLYSGWNLSPVNMVPCLPPLSELGTRRNLYNDSLIIGLYFFCTLHLKGSLSFVSNQWQSSFPGPPSCLGKNGTAQLISREAL